VNARTFIYCPATILLLAVLSASAAAQNPSPESKPQSSGESAAPGTAQTPKKPKHVFTDDDFAARHSSGGSSGVVVTAAQWSMAGIFTKDPVTAKDIAEAQKLTTPSYQFNLNQNRLSVANLYLQHYKDVFFAGRPEWEDRLFAEFECTRSAQGDYVKELDSVSKDPEYRELLVAAKFSDSELRKMSALRARLIADWEPVRVCEAKFDIIRKEGWQRAQEWLETHPPKMN
jgi:hypothetical protein